MPPVTIPNASYIFTPTIGEDPLTVTFTDTSDGFPTSYLWDFADGWSSTVQNPSHTFASAGTYNVTLEVTNPAGSDQVAHTITVIPPNRPIADFSGTPTSGSAPLTVTFTDASSETATGWFWEFGDGFTSFATNPAHTYIVAGTYTVSLTAYNEHGSDTETKTNYITVSPGAVSSATICGIVHVLSTFATIDDATVTIRNASGWSSTAATASGGYYEFEDLTPGAYTVQATKPGYAVSTTYAVQAYQASVSKQDIALTVSGVSLTGTCYDAVTGTPLEGAAVTATQGTATVTNTTNAAGTYLMDTFTTSSSIALEAALAGYTHAAITVTPTGDGPITRNLYLIPTSIAHDGTALGGLVTSTRDDQAVQGATVTGTPSSGGATASALTNPTGFYLLDNLAAGQWGVSAAATRYTTSQTYTHTLENGTLTLQDIRLEPESQASAASYTPKQVRFTYLSATGVPLAGLSVSAVGSATTALSWDWFLSLLGLDVAETNLATSVMSGITGSDGSIAFMMLESVYYTINASNPDLGIAITANIYPKEDQYVFTVVGDTPSSASRVTWDLTASAADETHTALALAYHDPGNRTQSLTFTVYDEARTLVHAETVTNTNEVAVSYTTANDPGAVMYWGFNATLIKSGSETETVQADQYIRFSGDGDGGLFAFGLPQVLRHWIGFLFLVCMGLLLGTMFGPGALKFAGPIIGIFALFLKFADWLPIGWEIAITIFVLGCLGYLRTAKDERMV